MAENLLTRLFQKYGIKSVADLSKEEQATFESYERVLSKQELSVQDIKEFLKSQIAQIEAKWSELGLVAYQKAELLPLHTAYKTLLNAIDAPLLEREQLEIRLRGMLDNN